MSTLEQQTAGKKLATGELSFMELEASILIMNRYTARWVRVPKTELPFVRLLFADQEVLSTFPPDRLDSLREALINSGLADPAPPGRDDLNTVILKLTNACNYACTYCYDFEAVESSQVLDEEIAISSVEQALSIAPTTLDVIFHGGEPTLVFPLIRKVVLASEKSAARLNKTITFSGQTNASRITRELVDFSEEHGINWGLSLDGPPAVNDALRILKDGRGTHELFDAALREFPVFMRRCHVMTTTTAINSRQLLSIARYFRDLGFAGWDWTLFQEIGRGRHRGHDLSFSTPDLVESWNELFSAVLAGEFQGFRVRPILSYVESFLKGPANASNMCMRRDCGAGRDLISISVNGTIEACDCIDPFGELANLGTMHGEGLIEARSSERANHIRSRDVTKLVCADCIWLTNCGGTCMAHAGAVDAIWDPQCALSLNAFAAIAHSIDQDDLLKKYLASCPRKMLERNELR